MPPLYTQPVIIGTSTLPLSGVRVWVRVVDDDALALVDGSTALTNTLLPRPKSVLSINKHRMNELMFNDTPARKTDRLLGKR